MGCILLKQRFDAMIAASVTAWHFVLHNKTIQRIQLPSTNRTDKALSHKKNGVEQCHLQMAENLMRSDIVVGNVSFSCLPQVIDLGGILGGQKHACIHGAAGGLRGENQLQCQHLQRLLRGQEQQSPGGVGSRVIQLVDFLHIRKKRIVVIGHKQFLVLHSLYTRRSSQTLEH